MKTLILLAMMLVPTWPAVAAPERGIVPQPQALSAGEIDDYAGQGEARDAEALFFSQQLVRQARAEGGTVKISTWVWHGQRQWYAQRQIESVPGCVVWQGPNPPMGYHTCQRTFQIIDYAKEARP